MLGDTVQSNPNRTTEDIKPPTQPAKKLKTSFLPQMRLLWAIRNREDYTPTLFHPYDVAFMNDGSTIVVVEGFWPYSRLQIFDLNGKSRRIIGQGEVLPFGIDLDSVGDMVVTDHKDRTVKCYTRNGNLKYSWQPNLFQWPKGVAHTLDNYFIITDWSQGEICIHEAEGALIRKFKCYGSDISEYSCPEYVCSDNHGRIIMTDTFDHSLKIFDPTGRFLSKIQKTTTGIGYLRDPRGICIDDAGNILVNDWGNNRVCQFGSNGIFIKDVLTSSDVSNPWGIAVGPNNNLVLSEQKLNASPSVKLFQSG